MEDAEGVGAVCSVIPLDCTGDLVAGERFCFL